MSENTTKGRIMEKERIAELRAHIRWTANPVSQQIISELLDALEAAQAREWNASLPQPWNEESAEKILALVEDRDKLRAKLAATREVLVESLEARRVTEAEGGSLNQANNEIDRLRAALADARAERDAGRVVPELTCADCIHKAMCPKEGYAACMYHEAAPSRAP